MADYKELLRRAIEVLPENNGAARRAVYEKARSALVGQLRAINPPLAARDITQHRLQLEDCIRDVEREASEANVTGLKVSKEAPVRAARAAPAHTPPPASTPVETPVQQVRVPPASDPQAPVPEASAPDAQAPASPVAGAPVVHPFKPVPRLAIVEPSPVAKEIKPASVEAAPAPAMMTPVILQSGPVEASEPAAEAPQDAEAIDKPEGGSIEDIIAAAERAAEQAPAKPELDIDLKLEPELPAAALAPDEANLVPPLFELEPRPMPTIVSPLKPPVPANSGFAEAKPFEPVRRGPTFDLRREAISTSQVIEAAPAPSLRFEPALRSQTVALQQVAVPIAILDHPSPLAPAMSAVREVEVEPSPEVAAKEAQVTIERAIATLDREARGETSPLINSADTAPAAPPPLLGLKRDQARQPVDPNLAAEQVFARPQADDEGGGFNAITIFLVVFALLLASAGGAGFWAWREGYIDFQAMFGTSTPVVVSDAQEPAPDASPTIAASNADPAAPATGPGNTATPEAQAPVTELKSGERLTGTPIGPATIAAPSAPLPVDPAAPQNSELKTEERLTVAETPAEPQVAPSQNLAIDPTAAAGSQSLLLEASDDGTTGAVPFSGTVEWSQGKDEMDQSTLVGKANIPARNLTVDMLIRKNSDPSLPASHLMEINFSVTDSFIGGSIAGLPGVLLKNEELVQGTPLVGASARVVGNSFLFALSASAEDAATNSNLLTSRKWIDLAIVYATGKRAIITLEKDEDAAKLFADVFKAWSAAAPAAASAAQ
jgi:hypothetical protein